MNLLDIARQHFDRKAQEFLVNPEGENWTNLIIAMWTLRGVHGMSAEESRIFLENVLFGIARKHKGDSNFGEGMQ